MYYMPHIWTSMNHIWLASTVALLTNEQTPEKSGAVYKYSCNSVIKLMMEEGFWFSKSLPPYFFLATLKRS